MLQRSKHLYEIHLTLLHLVNCSVLQTIKIKYRTKLIRKLFADARYCVARALTATNWLFSSLMISPTRTFIHFSFCSLEQKIIMTVKMELKTACKYNFNQWKEVRMCVHICNDLRALDEHLRLAVVHLVVTLVAKLQGTKMWPVIWEKWC